VGGEVFFDDCFNQNPLVNALSVGVVAKGKTVSAIAYGAGNPVFIVGSATGKDGIHGATFASGDLTQDSAKDLPSVQVGDPFQEKLLLEATLEVIKTQAIIGMQDMGAAGITCSTSEMSAKGNAGMIINLDKVPTRQPNMKAYEILLSESQERMLIVGKKGAEQAILDVFEKWDLNCVQIGEVIDENRLVFMQNNEIVAEVNPESLVLGGGAPQYTRHSTRPAYLDKIEKFDATTIHLPQNKIKAAMYHIATHPNIASKRWITQQYDGTIGTVNMCTNRPSAASIVNLKNTERAIALSVDCNSRYVYADPNVGTQIAVCEAARNIVCAGGEPLAISNCLNFGNPYNPEVYWQFEQAIHGMGVACTALNTPVTGGNVSFYNQSTLPDGSVVPVYPSPVIAMLGVLDDKKTHTGLAFENENDLIYLLGYNHPTDINCSQYIYSYHGVAHSPAPYFDMDNEIALHQNLRQIIENKGVVSANDVSDGGIFACLLECAMINNVGVNITVNMAGRTDAFLFGEAQSRAIVSVKAENKAAFEAQMKVDFVQIGVVQGTDFVLNGENYGSIISFAHSYDTALENILG
jgi:phosphoribosylformylglycinamidine synthase